MRWKLGENEQVGDGQVAESPVQVGDGQIVESPVQDCLGSCVWDCGEGLVQE